MSSTQPRPSDQSGPEQQPAGSGRKGRTVALAAGAVVVVAAIVGGIVLLNSGDDKAEDSASATADSGKKKDEAKDEAKKGEPAKYEGKRYRLTTPETVADGLKKESGSENENAPGAAFLSVFEKLGVSKAQGVGASYKGGENLGSKWLKFTGVYGDVADPEKTVDRYFASMASAGGKNTASDKSVKSEWKGSPTRLSVPGLDDDAVLKCQNVTYTSGKDEAAGRKGMSMPNCVWADHTTVGILVHSHTASMLGEVPLETVGALSAKVRSDVRAEIT
ncbi:hypothetical protein AB0I49_27495 [Streptomyces sp. NPDC050617]|uniref:hypothetical protein n=1 Tax=Streptomyces sp. NPDC050617 TaxID=3154628 RepID=UPI003437AA7A